MTNGLIKLLTFDLYVSFDNIRVGEMASRSLTWLKPKGNYFDVGGSPTDNNCRKCYPSRPNERYFNPRFDAKKYTSWAIIWAMAGPAVAALNIIENGLF